jgi:hypothetical protein
MTQEQMEQLAARAVTTDVCGDVNFHAVILWQPCEKTEATPDGWAPAHQVERLRSRENAEQMAQAIRNWLLRLLRAAREAGNG